MSFFKSHIETFIIGKSGPVDSTFAINFLVASYSNDNTGNA